MSRPTRQLVAVGAGHAHLHLAEQASALAQRGIRLTLIDPGAFWYSGLATGMLGGQYTADEDTLDPQPLVEPTGQFIRGRVTSIDLQRRHVMLDDEKQVPFDRLSFNVGSEVATHGIVGTEHAWTVKPIENLSRLRSHLEHRLTGDRPLRVTVVGGGATGCEIAANLLGLARRLSTTLQLHVFSSAARLMPDAPAGASRRMTCVLTRYGALFELRTRIAAIQPDCVRDDAGRRWPSDLTVLATGLKPPTWLASLGLPLGERGGLQVGPSLQSPADPHVFGVGDCIDFEPRPLPPLGVFGVRQAPILLHNLIASFEDSPLQPYRPQRRWLSILNLGDDTALARWGSFYAHGRWCMRWKNRLDQKFLKRYRVK
ncbi:FAD-dependent oxidoreductase [Phycisphaerales bacterium AB-hyl4]|uniref:FAD-dependent oxidoreductase n=1 Tax=Natronomicrosphaera hydrolytica TaxID=3242702 RepID=A0ABV4U7Z4_9BACT